MPYINQETQPNVNVAPKFKGTITLAYAIQIKMMTNLLKALCIVSSTVSFRPVARQIFLDNTAQFLHAFLTFEPRGVGKLACRESSTFTSLNTFTRPS